MEQGFIPTFEENNEMVTKDNELKELMVQIDSMEDDIKHAKEINDKYEDMKDKIKSAMIRLGKENDLTQVKWTTPKGIQITCSIGQKPIFEKVTEERFNEMILKSKYPEIYQECCEEVTYDSCVKAKTNDRLVITLPKGQ